MSDKIPMEAIVKTIEFWQEKLLLKDCIFEVLSDYPEDDDVQCRIDPRFGDDDRTTFLLRLSEHFWTEETAMRRFSGILHELLHVVVWGYSDAIKLGDMPAKKKEAALKTLNVIDERVVLKLEHLIRRLVPFPAELRALLSNPKKRKPAK